MQAGLQRNSTRNLALGSGRGVVFVAFRVVAQNLDHAAVGYHSARALHQHPFQLDLQRSQPRDARLNRRQLH